MADPYDALLLVSFGGPEKADDVVPFLENVVEGKNVPPGRVLAVAEHYHLFGGVSPINEQTRTLIAALLAELNTHGPPLPVYWGNRHWHPFLADTLRRMAEDGVRRALAFVTSAFGSNSSCRQYREAIERARVEIGPQAPRVDKLRLFYNHPGFLQATAERINDSLARIPGERRDDARIVFCAHSLPQAMADQCDYVSQVRDACRLIAELVGRSDWLLGYQSRSGPPRQPWLEPDVRDVAGGLHADGYRGDVVAVPLGWASENMEVIYDLDVELAGVCQGLGLNLVRPAVVGTHPRFVAMIRQLILERIEPNPTRLALGSNGPSHDICPADCCGPG